MRNDEWLLKNQIDPRTDIKYYYHYFPTGKLGDRRIRHAVATVCLVHLKTSGAYGRGIAFCSEKDQFCRRVGRVIALGRAIRALKKGNNEGTLPHILKNYFNTVYTLSDFIPNKSEILLTPHEVRLVSKA
jgi:hypothetical protein